jgi:hypothetical protein
MADNEDDLVDYDEEEVRSVAPSRNYFLKDDSVSPHVDTLPATANTRSHGIPHA